MSDYIDIVFDGPPSHESGRFVEVENSKGESIDFGEWRHRPDGYWALRIPREDNLPCPKCGKGGSSRHCVRCEFKKTLGKAMDKAEQKMQAENVEPHPNLSQRTRNTIGVVPPKSGTHTFSSGEDYNIKNDSKLRGYAQALVNKLKLINEDSRFKSVWSFMANHGVPYTGPDYSQELKDLEKALNESLCP